MVRQLQPKTDSEIIYPDSDGQPMAENTKQFRWIVIIKENLELLFANDDRVFVAGDLFWYPVEGNNKLRRAPDTMVVFSRPKGDRGSYKQWCEEDIPPQVVFEVLSPGNTLTEMAQKQQFYDRYGVEEYYLFDPEEVDLSGWLREDSRLNVIENIQGWVSPRLGIRFELTSEELEIFTPSGERFLSFVELAQLKQKVQQELESTQQKLQEAIARSQALEAKLRELGIDPTQTDPKNIL
ncbi:MAG: Uma2 family endonuclease [Oscillatoria sp. PMC 1068.18]|nr:Uma2 family endonuclease [Oscillatoria sp. PMC 1076.18]MEC4987648.1 Uma2 family endonuclease [Oscillatoria sp. PMC 1068.18]